MSLGLPSAGGARKLLQALRKPQPLLTRPAPAGRVDRGVKCPTDENVVETGVEILAAGGGAGTSVGTALLGRVDEVIVNNSTSDLDLAATSAITRAIVDYHCTRNGDTEWGQVDVVILDDGSTLEVIADPSWPSTESGCGLTFSANIATSRLYLRVTVSNATGSADFRGTWRGVRP